jgi:hypothetical protein
MTHRENVLKKYKLGAEGHSVKELSHIPASVLQQVYNRGIGAELKTNRSEPKPKPKPRPRTELPPWLIS